MRTIVFGDVHGNLPALEAMLRHAGAADRYVCLGDVVNYGPWSNECVDLIGGLPHCDTLIGNHDEAFLEGRYHGTHPVARAFFECCHPRFRRAESLKSYQASCQVGVFRAQHTIGGRYLFPNSVITLDGDYLIGHSHHQFRRESEGFELYNAGSVGQNRRRLDIVNYLVCGPGQRDVRMVGFHYNPDPVIAEMRRLNYPTICLEYYLNKWPRGQEEESS